MATSARSKHLPVFQNAVRLVCVMFALLALSSSPAALAVGPDADFESNGVLDSHDADLLTAEIAASTYGMTLDMNGDAVVDLADLDAWFRIYSDPIGVPVGYNGGR